MTREEAIKLIEHISITFVPTDQYGDYDDPQPYEEALDMAIEALQNLSKPNNGLQGSDLISRQDAIDAMDKLWGDIKRTHKRVAKGHEAVYLDMRGTIKTLPSADRPTTDCTEFMEWLKAEVLDENNWELNAVAYGEIICRKLKKLGWIDVEDGFYVDTRPTGEWVYQESENIEKIYLCSNCKNYEAWGETEKTPYCPNCGAKMKGGEA